MLRMPFGARSAPSYYKKLMDSLSGEYRFMFAQTNTDNTFVSREPFNGSFGSFKTV